MSSSEAQFTSQDTISLISSGDIDLLTTWHGNIKGKGSSSVQVSKDGRVGVDSAAVNDGILGAVCGGVLADPDLVAVGCEGSEMDGAGAVQSQSTETERSGGTGLREGGGHGSGGHCEDGCALHDCGGFGWRVWIGRLVESCVGL